MAYIRGAHRKVKVQTDSGQKDLGHAFIRAMLLGFPGRLANSNQEDQGFGKLSEESYLWGAQGKQLEGRRDCLSWGTLGKLHQESTLVILQAI